MVRNVYLGEFMIPGYKYLELLNKGWTINICFDCPTDLKIDLTIRTEDELIAGLETINNYFNILEHVLNTNINHAKKYYGMYICKIVE